MTAADLPALMPLMMLTAGSILCLLAGAFRPGRYLYATSLAVAAGALLWSCLLPVEATLLGLSVTPFSRFSSAFLYGGGMIALLLARSYNKRHGIVGEEYPATLLFALLGMAVSCAATDLLMIFLGLETFTFAFYILVAAKRDSVRGGEAGLKYLLNGTLSAAILAMGMALLYADRGTLKFTELACMAGNPTPLFQTGCVLILLGMAFKLSLVPAHLWTADVYQGATAPVTTLLSSASKGASLVALLLLLPLLRCWHGLHDLLWLLAALSLLAGNFAALVQSNLKRMLAWSSVGQMGYVALALVAVPSGGASAALFYMAVYAAAALATFGAISVLPDVEESDTIEAWRGVGYRYPLIAITMTVALFSLAGIPPTGGFMGKFGVFSAALRGGEPALAVIGILSALVAVFFYLRVVVVMYMKPSAISDEGIHATDITEIIALLVPTLVLLLLGLYPQPLLEVLEKIIIRQ